LGLTATKAPAQDKASDQLNQVIQYYINLEIDKGLELAQKFIARDDLTAQDSIAGFAVMSMLTYCKGEDYKKKAFGYLDKIATLGPCKIHLPYDFWPKPIREKWYNILKARDQLTCPPESKDIQTVAIMEFDNYSVGKYQEQLGFITKGLADFFESDFAKISDLKVVERDKIDVILKEIELGESGVVDVATAVRAGKLLGAQLMIFGSITQLDDKNTKMLVKAVKVETSEIIATVEKEGKPEYFKMEKELVEDMANKLQLTLNDDTKAMIEESGTDSEDAATLYSQGLYYMDQYDYKKAYEFFKKAYDMDNTFVEAKKKMDIYRPLAV
jgi:tetratricopeptide (TPR) repeat protein